MVLTVSTVSVAQESFTQGSLINVYRSQLQLLSNQLDEAIKVGGDDLEQNIEAVAFSAKMVLRLAQSSLQESFAKAEDVIDVIAASENKDSVATNMKLFVDGFSEWLESLQKMFNANLTLIAAAQGLGVEYQLQMQKIAAELAQ